MQWNVPFLTNLFPPTQITNYLGQTIKTICRIKFIKETLSPCRTNQLQLTWQSGLWLFDCSLDDTAFSSTSIQRDCPRPRLAATRNVSISGRAHERESKKETDKFSLNSARYNLCDFGLCTLRNSVSLGRVCTWIRGRESGSRAWFVYPVGSEKKTATGLMRRGVRTSPPRSYEWNLALAPVHLPRVLIRWWFRNSPAQGWLLPPPMMTPKRASETREVTLHAEPDRRIAATHVSNSLSGGSC